VKNSTRAHLAQRKTTNRETPGNVHGAYRALRRRFFGGPTERVHIQFIRDRRLLSLEMNEAIRLLKIIKTSHQCAPAAKRCADLLLRGISHGREIFDQHPLISEIGKQRKSAPIYIDDAVWLAMLDSIIATSRANGGRDD
jgi:hypothetical protein